MKIKTILLKTIVPLATVGVVAGAGVGIYLYAKKQSVPHFVVNEHTSISRFFNEDNPDEPTVEEKFIAGEKGYQVDSGPIRINSAYKSLLSKDTLIDLAKWVNKDIAWGANGISLRSITFTTGIDKTNNGTTKGFHTAGREASSIFISPDAFEDLGNFGQNLFNRIVGSSINSYKTEFKTIVEKNKSKIKNPIGHTLDQQLSTTFNGSTNALATGKYRKLSDDKIKDIIKSTISESWNDNFLSKLTGGSVGKYSGGSYLGDGFLSAPERIAYAKSRNKLGKLLNDHMQKLNLANAFKILNASTNGPSGLANLEIQTMLKIAIFNNGETFKFDIDKFAEQGGLKDFNENIMTYGIRPSNTWEKALGLNKIMDTDLNKATITSMINADHDSYFYTLFDSGMEIPKLLERARIFKMFMRFYNHSNILLNDKAFGAFDIIKNMWKDEKIQVLNNWINHTSRMNATQRVSFLINGSIIDNLNLNASGYDERNLLSNRDRNLVHGATTLEGREVPISNGKNLYSKVVNTFKFPGLDNKSIAEFYRAHILESMKYTISHEYGHHETMYSTYGVYGKQDDGSIGNYEDTYNIYSEKNSAKGEDHISKKSFEDIREISTHEPGIKNAVSVMERSHDRFSSTWTPTFTAHNYLGFNPKKGWSHAQEDLWQKKLKFQKTPSGGQKISWDNNEYIGTAQTYFDTRGVDADGIHNNSNYLYSIDKTKLSSDNLARTEERRIGDFIRNFLTADDMLYGYQISKWLMEPGKYDEAWQKKTGIILPKIDSKYIQNPTVGFTPVLTKDPADNVSKYVTLKGIIRMSMGLNVRDSQEVVDQLDAIIGTLYAELVTKTPDLFYDINTKSHKNAFERNSIIMKQVVINTREALKRIGSNTRVSLKGTTGVFYDPDSLSYRNMDKWYTNPQETGSEQSDRWFKSVSNSDGSLVQTGSVVLGQSKSSFTDYTGGFPEFMTRTANQLQFRPDYSKFIDSKGVMNTGDLVDYNSGWYDDINRFHAMGMDMYNISLEDGKVTNSKLTATGSKILNWYRSIIGLHVADLNAVTTKTNGEVDFDALDNQILYADPLSKVYTNPKTDLTTAWGWMPSGANYTKVRFKKPGKNVDVKIHRKHTSNYFYREDMTNEVSKKHSMNKGYDQWAMDWTITGDFDNTGLSSGKYEMVFIDKDGNEVNPYTNINKTPNNNKQEIYKYRTNNDYVFEVRSIMWSAKQGKIELTIL